MGRIEGEINYYKISSEGVGIFLVHAALLHIGCLLPRTWTIGYLDLLMDVGPLSRSAPPPDEAFNRLLSIVLSPGSPIYDTSVPKRRITRLTPPATTQPAKPSTLAQNTSIQVRSCLSIFVFIHPSHRLCYYNDSFLGLKPPVPLQTSVIMVLAAVAIFFNWSYDSERIDLSSCVQMYI